jgi:hypothetical protein
MGGRMTFCVRNYPGYTGAFTRDQAPGALASGTRIMKTDSEEGDANPDGALGTVLGSLSHPEVQNGALMYFIEWDAVPKVAVGCMGFKVRAAS